MCFDCWGLKGGISRLFLQIPRKTLLETLVDGRSGHNFLLREHVTEKNSRAVTVKVQGNVDPTFTASFAFLGILVSEILRFTAFRRSRKKGPRPKRQYTAFSSFL